MIFAAIASMATDAGTGTLIIAHRRELVRQASAKLTATGVRHGILSSKGSTDPDALIQVGSVQSLARMASAGHPLASGYRLIVIDEAHHSVAGDYLRVIEASGMSSRRCRILGVTATPQRLDGRGLGRASGGFYDALIQGPTIAELVQGEFLVPARVFAPAGGGPDLAGIRKVAGDYAQGALGNAMARPQLVGDAVEHYRRHADGRPTIAFCSGVAHAKIVASAFAAAGYRAVAVDGTTPASEREAAITGLEDDRTQILCAADLISEGLDVPGVECVILLRPTHSLCLHVQQVGRGLRPAPGKGHLIILDHAGNSVRHGLPDEAHEWSLDGKAKRARTAPAISQCPGCYALHRPTQTCPECGHDYADDRTKKGARGLKTVAGELVEITAAQRAALKRDAREVRAAAMVEVPLENLIADCRTMRDFLDVAAAKGFAPGWAWHQFQNTPGARRFEGRRSR